jgi:transketolase
MRKIFGQTVVKLAQKDPKVVLLTGDVEQEMDEFKSKFSDRFFNLGMAEQSITSMAAGLAIEGMRPIVYSITPFVLERPFEQVKIDIDEQNLPVLLIGYSDYPTHGPTHRPLNPERLVTVFKNIQSYFPCSSDLAEKAILDAYLIRRPALIFLKKDGLPIV